MLFFSPTFLCLFIMVVVKVDFPISGIEAEKYLTILKMYSYTPQALEMKLIDFIPTNIPTIMLSLSAFDLCCSKLLSAGAELTMLAKMS